MYEELFGAHLVWVGRNDSGVVQGKSGNRLVAIELEAGVSTDIIYLVDILGSQKGADTGVSDGTCLLYTSDAADDTR